VDGAGVQSNDLVCDECQFAAEELKTVITEAQTQAEIKQFLSTEICSRLGKYRGSCDLMVEDFLPQLFEQLEQMLQNTKQFCADLGLCARQAAVLNRRQQTAKLLGTLRTRGLYTSMNQLESKKSLVPGVRVTCLECKLAVDAILLELKLNATIVKLADDIRDLVCPKLPEAWHAGCEDFLNLYARTVVWMTIEQFNPEQICESLHMCDDRALATIARLSDSQASGIKCEACEIVTSFIGKQLSNPQTKEELQWGMSHLLCDKMMPSAFVNVCENFAETYMPTLLNKLQQKLMDGGGEKVCHAKLHAC